MSTYKKVKCEFCDDYLNAGETGTYKRILGWVPVRAAGGANTITLSEEPDAWAHAGCIELQRQSRKPDDGQAQLF